MKPKIVEKGAFKVIGLTTKVSLTDPMYQGKIKTTWMKFMERAKAIPGYSMGIIHYGPCDPTKGIEGDPCSFTAMAGIELKEGVTTPKGFEVWDIPARKYAVWTHTGRVEKLGETYRDISEKWLKENDLKEDMKAIWFELYDERFDIDSPDSEIDIYVALA